jgi:hypothetical protein
MKTINQEEGFMPVVFANDGDDFEPYATGDYTLLTEVVCWLMLAYDYARQQWVIAEQEHTIDALSWVLGKMHLNDVQVAHFRRLLAQADEILVHEQQVRTKMRDLAAKVK